MAEDKGTSRQEFPEVRGKVVEVVELEIEADFYGIAIRFQDKTSLTFSMESCVFAFPVMEDWTDGEGKIIKEYEPVRSRVEGEDI